MFDDFDMGISVEEISGYDVYEAFENFYGEGFEDYCDSLERGGTEASQLLYFQGFLRRNLKESR